MKYVTFFTSIFVFIAFQFLPAQDPFPGTALEFDGVDDYVQADSLVIPSSGNFTVSLWAKVNSIPPGYVEMLSQNAGSGEDFYIGKTSIGNVRAGDDWGDTGVPFPTDGLWHYYTVVKETLNTHLYIDGYHRASKNASIVNPAGSEFRIARQYGIHGEYFPGLIEEVRIWNTARTTQEIRENMHLTLTGSESGLVCYWQFNEAAGDTTYDPVGGYNGILFNMDSTDWTQSTVPVGGGNSFTQIVSSTGVFDFSGTNLSMDFISKIGVDTIVVSRSELAPNTTPGNYATFSSQYWVARKYGSGSFLADLTFTPNEIITPEDEISPGGLRLFNRISNSDGSWSNFMGGTAASASNNTVTFDSVSTFSQFLIGRQQFTNINAGLTAVYFGSVTWGDYDNDGDLDILLVGNTSSAGISRIYRNDAGIFTDIIAGLTGVSYSSAAWGDYDNDGDLDILLAGSIGTGNYVSRVYRNDGGVFGDINAGLTGVSNGSVAWGDYDNDGDLDILLTGQSSTVKISRIYRNDGGVFSDINAGLIGVLSRSVAWGDYDNDGDLDILLTGFSVSSNIISRIYRNDSGIFTDINAGLTGVTDGSVAWGDYDNDGDLDILLTGWSSSGEISRIYRNDGGVFSNINTGLTGVLRSSVAWGDYDNDGDLDILLTGYLGSSDISRIYRNDSGVFSDINAGLIGVQGSSVAWGDYDNDGDLDILLTGRTGSYNYIFRIYCNNNQISNIIPSSPDGLTAVISSDSLTFFWNKASDNETAQNGLSYNLFFGNSEYGLFLKPPMADLGSGFRHIPGYGNVCQVTSWTSPFLTLYLYPQVLTPDYWGVQAIDHAFAGSPFATDSINITISNLLTNNNNIMQLTDLLSWEIIFGDSIISYQVQIDNDSAFTDCEVDDTLHVTVSGSGNYFNIPLQTLGGSDSLIAGTKYYWRVKPNYTFGLPTVFTHQVPSFWFGFVSKIEDEKEIPTQFSLYQNYPNPFNPSTRIEFDLPKRSEVILKVYNILGEEVATLASDRLFAGSYSYELDASNFASGIYLYRLQAGEYVETKKMILMK